MFARTALAILAVAVAVNGDAHLKKGVFGTKDKIDTLSATFSTPDLGGKLAKALNAAMNKNTAMINIIKDFEALKTQLKTEYVANSDLNEFRKEIAAMKSSVDATTSKLEAASKKAAEDAKKEADELKKELDGSLAKAAKETEAALKASEEKTTKSVSDLMASSGTVLNALKHTHWANPKIPVYRWKMWDTHHHGISWFDENRNQGFAGEHPSHWTDGNRAAYQMANSWAYLKRLFNQKQVADGFGATVCAMTYMMFSSTGGHLCGAIFRIKNTQTSTVNWRPNMLMTSFSHWSERASISVNGGNNYNNGGCHTECNFTPTLGIPANSNKDRISTVAFISSSSRAYGGWYSIHERAVILMFKDNSLKLPNNLEYVDDFDTLTGAWKQ